MKKVLCTFLLFNLLAMPMQGMANGETGVTVDPQDTISQTGVTAVSSDSVIQNESSTPTPPDTEVPSEPVVKSGWITEEGKTYYYDPTTGEMKKGWILLEGIWYYLHPQTGERQKGWIWDNAWYYLNGNGEMHTGWVWDKKWYYLTENGKMKTGWLLDKNKWYYLNNSGAMQTGWVFVYNKWYYLEASGAMKTGWVLYQNNWYFLKDTGVMATGWYIVDHLWYYSYPSGVMAKNTTIQGYYLTTGGAWYPDLVNPKQNYSYNDLAADIREFQVNYPDLVQTQIIGKSVDGRNLYALKLGKGEKEIFFNGSHHAREHMTTNLLMEMIDQYALSYARYDSISGYNVRQLLNKVSIWFVPMVNPDGAMLVQEGAYTAKNPNYVLALNGGKTDFSAWKANVRGVDLNRQYPADWADIRDNSGYPGPSHFKGYQPLSEPEVQAIVNFTKSHPFKIAVAYHSSGRILYWDYKQAAAERARDYQIALKYSNLTGYGLVSQGSNPSGGGYTDWFIQEMKLPGFTPEISPYTYNKPVPIANFDGIWSENRAAGLMLAQEALNL